MGYKLLCFGLLIPIFIYFIVFVPSFIYHRYVMNEDPEFLFSLGSATHSSAKIWVRAKKGESFSVEYRCKSKDHVTSGSHVVDCQNWCQSEWIKFNNFSIGIKNLQNLIADSSYDYRIIVTFQNGTKFTSSIATFRTFPEKTAKDFNFVFGSCVSPSVYPWDEIKVFCDMAKSKPRFSVILGDIAYMDIDKRLVPFWRIPYDQSYLQVLVNECVQSLIKYTPSIHMFDDHEIENDFRGQSFDVYDESIKYWYQYVGNRNPRPLVEGSHYFTFNYTETAGFFVIDTRSHMSDKGVPKENVTLLGSRQKAELKAWLLNSKFLFKFISSPVSWSTDGTEFPEFHHEYDEIFDFIEQNSIKNVFILSGDMHYGSVYRYRKLVYEFSASPFQAVFEPPYARKMESDTEETLLYSYYKFHSGYIEIKDRTLNVTIYGYHMITLEQQVLYNKIINAE